MLCLPLSSNSWCAAIDDYTLPLPSGPYPVGTHEFRPEGRRLIVQFWYPCVDDKTASYAPYAPEIMSTYIDDITHPLMTRALLNTIPISGKFPTILFLHGLGNHRRANTVACCELASHGYIVVSIDHPGIASLIQFSDGEKLYGYEDEDFRKHSAIYMQTMVEEVAFVLKSLETCPFVGVINFDKIGMLGMSIGGMITIKCLSQIPALKVGVSFDGPPLEAYTPLQKKFLLLLAQDSEEYFENEGTPKERLVEYRESLRGKAIRVMGSKHADFNDTPFLVDHLVKICCLPENKVDVTKDFSKQLEKITSQERAERFPGEAKEIERLLSNLTEENMRIYLHKNFERGTINNQHIVQQIYNPMRDFFDRHLKGSS